MNWTIYMEKKRVRVCPPVPKPNLICQKTRESLSLSLPLYSRHRWAVTEPGDRRVELVAAKKMNGVDTIRLREETTFISCFEYESVHHQHHPEREREKKKKRNISFSKSHFTIGRSHISIKAISILRIVLILSVKKFHFDKSYSSIYDNRKFFLCIYIQK